MPYIWDIISVLVLVICIYFGVKRGFVRSLVTSLSYLIAVIISVIASPKVSTWIYNTFIAKGVTETITQQLKASAASSGQAIMLNLPAWMLAAIEETVPDFTTRVTTMVEGPGSTNTIEQTARSIGDMVSGPIIQVMSMFVFIVMILLLSILIKKIAKIFTGINHIPLVGTLNMLLGGGAGVITGIVLIMIVAAGAVLLGTALGGKYQLLNKTTIDASYIMGTLMRLAGTRKF